MERKRKALLLIDANSGLDNKDFAPFIAEASLCDAIGGYHDIDAPNTQVDGSKAINFIFATPNVMDIIYCTGMLQFYDGIHSDHRGLYCNIYILQLLWGEIHQIPPQLTCCYHTRYRRQG
eukprot:15335098-Ditylum_brightwellii.AAC.1